MEHDDAKRKRRDAGLLCRAGDAEGRVEVDVVGPLLVQIADGVVRECREMHDRVEAVEVRRRDVADVAAHRRDRREVCAEVAALVEARVEADDVVPCRLELRREDRADVPVAAGDEDAHPVGHGAITSFGALKASA